MVSAELQAHLDTGHTHLARCWRVARSDGIVMGFTDHDNDLTFEGIPFRADTGMSGKVLEQSTGLSVDNSEALGALSDAAISEGDILEGRFDGAEVTAWLVNWSRVEERVVVFAGRIGEISRSGGAFKAELRGLTEPLNQAEGRIYQRACSAVLGDRACGFDLSATGFQVEVELRAVEQNRILFFDTLEADEGWFAKGRVDGLSGRAAGLYGLVKSDGFEGNQRRVELWAPLAAPLNVGDQLRLTAGCDKRFETCRLKFANHYNFRGFPDIPSEDWLVVGPRDDGRNDGGSLRS